MQVRSLTSIVLALAGASAALASDNLISNGAFATDLADWQAGGGAAIWSAESALADGTGSAWLTNDASGGGLTQSALLQCAVVTPGAHFLRLAVRVPAGQPTTGHAYGTAYAYAGSACTGSPVASGRNTIPVATATWSFRGISIDVPAGAASVSVRLDVYKLEPGGSFDALADAVELRTGLLFADGLESGSTTLWSAVAP